MAQFCGSPAALKRGMPITPVQLENVTLPNFLDEQRVLLLTYQGQKPLTPACIRRSRLGAQGRRARDGR
jgi:hypothetical protein